MTIWGLLDDRTGHTGQVLGVITKLQQPFMLKRLEYNFLSRLPTALLGSTLAHLDPLRGAIISPPWPKLVIAAGRRMVPVLRHIKHKSPSTRIVYLMWPERREKFDLMVVPEHDGVAAGGNIITTTAPLHAVTPEMLAKAAEAWHEKFVHLPKPWVALCIGGNTKHTQYSPHDWQVLLAHAQQLAGTGSLLVTTSRRTPSEVAPMLHEALHGKPHQLYAYDAGKDNPYFGFLACADAVIVTGDSLSMCAEATASGKPLYIFVPQSRIPEKHARLHHALYAKHLALPLSDTRLVAPLPERLRHTQSEGNISAEGGELFFTPANTVDDAGLVAHEIATRFPELALHSS